MQTRLNDDVFPSHVSLYAILSGKCLPLLSTLLISSLDSIFNFLSHLPSFSFFNMAILVFFHQMRQFDLNKLPFRIKLESAQ